MTPDNDKIAMFKVIIDGSIVYTSTQTNQLKLITYDSSGNASTNSLNDSDSGWWGDLFLQQMIVVLLFLVLDKVDSILPENIQ